MSNEMTQQERRLWLIDALLAEDPRYDQVEVPQDVQGQKQLLRSLMNLRPPKPLNREFLVVQDAYLAREAQERGIVQADGLQEVEPQICLWQGDICRLAADGIVNAANDRLLGCFHPCHGCIDNAIHSAAGLELRQACADLMAAQGHPEPCGQAKLTPAFNLPSRFVLHTVGPIVRGPLARTHKAQLASCYESCLALAEKHSLKGLAFCCISCGEYGFPADEAALIATTAVRDYLRTTSSSLKVIFNVFTNQGLALYQAQLGQLHP